jgi:hypothetical protein
LSVDLSLPSMKRRTPRKPVIALDAQVAEIVEALTALGGEAHRSLVLQQIASARFGMPAKVTPTLERDVIAAFEAHCRLPGDVTPRVRGSFGLGSHRWALARN